MGKFYFYTLFDTTFQLYHQYRDIFINITFINSKKTIITLCYLLLNRRFHSSFSLFAIDLPLESPEIRRLSPDAVRLSEERIDGDLEALEVRTRYFGGVI